MKSEIIYRRAACCVLWLLLPFGANLAARGVQADAQVDVPSLVGKLEDGDEKTVMAAASALMKAGPGVIPALLEGLRRRKGCQFQFVASGVVYELDRKHEAVEPALVNVARGRCEGSSRNDMAVRRQAAFALVVRADGIPAVAEMLADEDTFTRRSAAFAFDELTERIGGARPDAIKATPEIIAAAKAALPSLVKALGDRDEVVRCMSYEAVEQTQASSHVELRAEADRLMRGVKVRCSR